MIRLLSLLVIPMLSLSHAVFAQDPGVSRIDIEPDTLRLKVGSSATLSVSAFDADDDPVEDVDIAWFAGWESARIDGQGRLLAINVGTTVAGGTVSGATTPDGNPITDRIVVIVEPGDPEDIRLTTPDFPLPAGSLVPVQAVATDGTGNELWDHPVSLETSDASVAEMIGSSLKLHRAGETTLTARVGATTREVTVMVSPAPAGAIALETERSSARTGDAVRLALRVGGEDIAYPQWWISPAGASVEADNYFVAEEAGEYQIAATVGEQTATTTISVEPRDIEGGWLKVGHVVSPARTSDLWVFEGQDGRDYVYFGSFGAQMRVYDVTDPANPMFTDSVVVSGRRVNDVKINEDASIAVITLENDPTRRNGIVTLDITDPAHPEILTHYYEDLTGGIHNTFIAGDLVYAVNDGTRDVHIIDISDPANPKQVGRWGIDTPRKALHDIWIADGLAYLSYWDDGLVVIDVGRGIAGGTPTEPQFVSRINYPSGNTHVAWPWKNYVFLGDEIAPTRYSPDAPPDARGFVHIIDMTDPFDPREVGKYEVPEGGSHNLWVHDDVLYIGYYQRGLRAVDLSGGELRGDLYRQGREIDYFLTETSDPARSLDASQVNRTNVWGAMWHKGHVFVIDTNSGLWIMKLDLPDKEIALR